MKKKKYKILLIEDDQIDQLAFMRFLKNHTLLYTFSIAESIEKAWELINMANKFVEETKPWNLAKEQKTPELQSFLHLLIRVIRAVKDAIEPFMPRTAGMIEAQIGEGSVKKGSPLFPRIE